MIRPGPSVRYRLGCDLNYEVRSASTFFFGVEVARLLRHQNLEERLVLEPGADRQAFVQPGTGNRYVRVAARPGPLGLSYRAEVTLEVHHADPDTIGETPLLAMPPSVIPFLLPSRYVPSDRLAAFALKEFGHLFAGHGRVTAICNWIYDNIDYRPGASNVQTAADESLLARAGVCRDFAHLGIAFCRALAIPARFVSCYAYGLPSSDFHAVFEAYLGGRWWLFDATRQANPDGLLRIGVGRDAAESAFATSFGDVGFGPMSITIDRVDGSAEALGHTVDAVSTDEPVPDAGAC